MKTHRQLLLLLLSLCCKIQERSHQELEKFERKTVNKSFDGVFKLFQKKGHNVGLSVCLL